MGEQTSWRLVSIRLSMLRRSKVVSDATWLLLDWGDNLDVARHTKAIASLQARAKLPYDVAVLGFSRAVEEWQAKREGH